jgi:acyl carrier protein
MSTLLQLSSIFQEVFDDPTLSVGEDTCSEDLEAWDSVAQVKLVLAIEEEFAVRLTSDDLTNIHTVGDFISAIAKQKGLSA